jgi:hypothetical protein
MPDLETFSTALSSLKTATDIVKLIKDSDIFLDKTEIKLKLADLTSALAETKIQLADIKELLIEKDKKIRELEERITIVGNVVYEDRYYWKIVDDQKDGPFCQRCFDADSKLIRLQKGHSTLYEHTSRWYSCHKCKCRYDEID